MAASMQDPDLGLVVSPIRDPRKKPLPCGSRVNGGSGRRWYRGLSGGRRDRSSSRGRRPRSWSRRRGDGRRRGCSCSGRDLRWGGRSEAGSVVAVGPIVVTEGVSVETAFALVSRAGSSGQTKAAPISPTATMSAHPRAVVTINHGFIGRPSRRAQRRRNSRSAHRAPVLGYTHMPAAAAQHESAYGREGPTTRTGTPPRVPVTARTSSQGR